MEIRKADACQRPSYPDRETSLNNPALLQSLPERWKANASACAALAMTSAILLSACQSQPAPADTGANGTETSAPASFNLTPSPSPSPTPSPTPTNSPAPQGIAAPLFEHGEGRGSFGCVSVAPPAFLSEEEAFAVINGIAEKEGLSFKSNGPNLEGVGIPVTDQFTDQYNNAEGPLPVQQGALLLDGIDEEKKVAFEFISTVDMESWQKQTNRWSSVSDYNFVEAARALHGGLEQKTGGMTVAVFYDPHYSYNAVQDQLPKQFDPEKMQAAESGIKELVKEDLRKQVMDFIKWLKAQGII